MKGKTVKTRYLCPFCGGHLRVFSEGRTFIGMCQGDGAVKCPAAFLSIYGSSEKEVAEKWDIRYEL